MRWLNEVALLSGLFVLRLGIPLAITILISWGLGRLDRRWQAEAEAQRLLEALPTATNAAGAKDGVARRPCWLFRDCTEERRSACAAGKEQSLPCWMVRLRAEGRLPATCPGCALFRATNPTQSAVA